MGNWLDGDKFPTLGIEHRYCHLYFILFTKGKIICFKKQWIWALEQWSSVWRQYNRIWCIWTDYIGILEILESSGDNRIPIIYASVWQFFPVISLYNLRRHSLKITKYFEMPEKWKYSVNIRGHWMKHKVTPKFWFQNKFKTRLATKTKVRNQISGFKPNDRNVFRQTVVTKHLEIKSLV